MRKIISATLLFFSLTGIVQASPVLKGTASFFLPGSGQLFEGNYGEAALHYVLYSSTHSAYNDYTSRRGYMGTSRFDHANEIEYINDTTLKADFYGLLSIDTAFYSAFAAYRDARLALGNEGYKTAAPQESLADLVSAPFRWEYLKRPTTFIPILGIAAGVSLFEQGDPDDGFYEQRRIGNVGATELNLFNTFGVGMGPAVAEEAFFRGFLNNALSNNYGEIAGLIISSTAFGLAHAGNGNQATPLAAALGGAYMGWLQQRNNYDIREGVTLHFWNNFLVGLAEIKHGRSARLLSVRVPF